MAAEPTDCSSVDRFSWGGGGVKSNSFWGKKGGGFLLLTGVVNQNASILASPDLVPPDFRIAASPVNKKKDTKELI